MFGWLMCSELVFVNCKVRLCLCLKGVLAFELVDGVLSEWMVFGSGGRLFVF